MWPFKKKPDFYHSSEWRELRLWAIKRYGARCMKCGSYKDISVDHIKSRKLYPHLQLKKSWVQILCLPCNKRKGYISEADYRPFIWKLYYWLRRVMMGIIGIVIMLGILVLWGWQDFMVLIKQ